MQKYKERTHLEGWKFVMLIWIVVVEVEIVAFDVFLCASLPEIVSAPCSPEKQF